MQSTDQLFQRLLGNTPRVTMSSLCHSGTHQNATLADTRNRRTKILEEHLNVIVALVAAAQFTQLLEQLRGIVLGAESIGAFNTHELHKLPALGQISKRH